MGFDTFYRFSVHAVILDEHGRVLLLKQTYGDKRWGLPGGGVEPGETVHEAILRECREELGVDIDIEAFTGLYYHSEFNAQVGIFRCQIPKTASISFGPEHSEYAWFALSEISGVQSLRVRNAIQYGSTIASHAF